MGSGAFAIPPLEEAPGGIEYNCGAPEKCECEPCPECNEGQWKKLYEAKAGLYDKLMEDYEDNLKKHSDERESFHGALENWENLMEYKRYSPKVDVQQEVLTGGFGAGKNIHVNYGETIYVLNTRNSPYTFTCSGSMGAILSCRDALIVFRPSSADQIHVGDTIIFRDPLNAENIDIMHQVVYRDCDEKGIWFKTMGLSNTNFLETEEKIRFHRVKFKMVGVLYGAGKGKEVLD